MKSAAVAVPCLLRGQVRCKHCAQAGHNVSHERCEQSSRVAWQTSACHDPLTKIKLYTAPFLYHPDCITSLALGNDAGIVFYIFILRLRGSLELP